MPPRKKAKNNTDRKEPDQEDEQLWEPGEPSSLHAMITAGENIKIVGYMTHVPFKCMVVDGMAIDGKGMRQRGLHSHSVTEASIRKNGWNYDQGAPLRLIEIPWTDES